MSCGCRGVVGGGIALGRLGDDVVVRDSLRHRADALELIRIGEDQHIFRRDQPLEAPERGLEQGLRRRAAGGGSRLQLSVPRPGGLRSSTSRYRLAPLS